MNIKTRRSFEDRFSLQESVFLKPFTRQIIFDKIFGSRDEERRNNLPAAFRTKESCFPQILLISHIAEMQGGFANTLVIEPGSDNAGRVRAGE